ACSVDRPALDTVAGGRQVACHFWREIAAAGQSPLTAPPPSAAFAKRLTLYRRGRPAAPSSMS
ncbi:hypothetical protein J8J27_34485, partial [Mycobacterium tuberculosis]|nr:hypothetical protein [Mycobacterium tuberculosis]